MECDNCIETCPQYAIKNIKEKILFAIGTDDGKTIKSDDHIGSSKYYFIYEYDNDGVLFIEKRDNPKYKEDETRVHGDPGKAQKVASVLRNVDVIVGKILGPNVVRLKQKFVPVVIREANIEKAINIIKENINEIIDEKNKKERIAIILK
jgi:predicted Fe-Mo cluster-binding NifX family protein